MLVLTVIGLLFLMLQKTEKNIFKNTSIIISEDGITYCDSEDYTFISFKSLLLNKEKDLNQWILKNNINNDTIIIIANNPGLFVPQALFNKNILNKYYQNFDHIEETDLLKIDVSKNNLNSIIYKVSGNIETFKNKYFSNLNQVHYHTIFYNYLIEQINTNEKKLFVNIQKYSFDFFLFYGDQLQLANRYPNKGYDSFMYFLYFIVEKKELNLNEFFVYFLGKYKAFSKYYEGVKLYNDNLEYILPKNNYKTNIPSTPFLIDLHANYIWNS